MAIRRHPPAAPDSHAATSAEGHRLFFALLPDADTRSRLARVATALRADRPGWRAHWIHPDRYHATLHFLGNYPSFRPDLVAAARTAAQIVHAAPFEWTLDHAASFPGRRPPCVLRCSAVPGALQQLWHALHHALALAGQGDRLANDFIPHVTLAYGEEALAEPVAVATVRWQAEDFALLHSVTGQGDHQILGRWPLVPRIP
jgi:2'-5' RNA ligase